MANQAAPQDLAYNGYRWRHDDTDKSKSVCQGNEQNNGQDGIIPSTVEKSGLDPNSQGNHNDQRKESRKQAKLNTRQQPYHKHWNDRYDYPYHGYQTCQRTSKRQ